MLNSYLVSIMTKKPRKTRSDKWEPTPEDLAKIETLAGHGLPIEQIASLIGISKPTLDRHKSENSMISDAIMRGRSKAHSNVAQTAYKMAKDGHPRVLQFWLKCQAGWREHGEDDDKPSNGQSYIKTAY